MKRSLWGNSHRRPGPEAAQVRPGPSFATPARHRPGQQRRGPVAPIDERRVAPASHPGQQPGRADVPLGIEPSVRNAARDYPAAMAPELEAEQHRQSEIARIRNEIMNIAREVAELRRGEHKDLAPAATSNSARPPRLPGTAGKESQNGPAQASPAPDSSNRPHAARPPASSGKRSQLVERAHRNSRVGNAEAATGDAPVRTKRPPLTVREEVLRFSSATPEPSITRADAGHFGMAARTAMLTGVMLAMLMGTSLLTLGLMGKLPLPAHDHQKSLLAEATASLPTMRATGPSQPYPAPGIEQASATYPFEIPETYGVYAVNDGRLTPLDPLPVRVPDARVSISSPISKPAPEPLASGNLQFAVYHRELATSVPESASVRIVAKVMQATTFVGGKPKSVPVEDTWAVRGNSIDFRIAPVAANKEMILIRPADPRFTLSPGRYVLIFRNQAYDFSVAGTVSETAHCLERSDLQERSVYSECRELPARL